MNPSLAPSLDGFLKVHGLTIASFDGKSTEAALRMCGLDDRALANLGDAHRDRCLVVRGALLDRLTRDPNPYPEEDTGDEPNEGDDSPTRKGKKKVKPAADDDEEAAEEPRDTTPDRHEPRAMAEAIMLAGQRTRGIEPSRVHRAIDDRVLSLRSARVFIRMRSAWPSKSWLAEGLRGARRIGHCRRADR